MRTTTSNLPTTLDAAERHEKRDRQVGNRSTRDDVIGCPVEEGESRQTILTTDVATILLKSGFRGLAAAGIGDGIGVPDEVYRSLGIEITDDATAWGAPLVLRYRCPAPSLRKLRPHQGIAALFHAEGDPAALAALAASGAVAWAYELIEDDGCFPLGRTNGEIAGIQAVLMAAHHLQTGAGGPGVLLAAVPGAIRPQVVVIGNGNVGAASARTAAALGAAVTVLAHSRRSAERYRDSAPTGVQVVVNDRATLLQSLVTADVVIGAILVSTFDTSPMITEANLRVMKPGAVIVDATCGYGAGFLPTAGPIQQPGDPPLELHAVRHIKIDVLPSLVPITAAQAYGRNAASYLVRLARRFFDRQPDAVIDSGCIARGGQLIHPVIAEHAEHYRVAR